MTDLGRLVIHLLVGTPQFGAWCPDCALPSVITAPLYSLTPHGVTPVGTWRRCQDCGRHGQQLDTAPDSS